MLSATQAKRGRRKVGRGVVNDCTYINYRLKPCKIEQNTISGLLFDPTQHLRPLLPDALQMAVRTALAPPIATRLTPVSSPRSPTTDGLRHSLSPGAW
jgi:hypothetical protein